MRTPKSARQTGRVCRASMLASALLAIGLPTWAGAYDSKDCEQNDTAWLALRACSALLELPGVADQKRADFHVWRGYAWLKEEEPKEAVNDFTRALTISPKETKALAGRARAHALLHSHRQAAQDWTAYIETGVRGIEAEEAYLARGDSLLADGDFDAALRDFVKMADEKPTNIAAFIGMARAHAVRGDRAEALHALDRAQKIDANDMSPYLARGEIAESWGDNRLAIANYMAAIDLNPRGAWVARRALRRLGAGTQR